jgi:hypothetical protein
LLAAHLLRRHVVDRAHHRLAAGERRRHEARQPEIENPDFVVLGDEHVGGLDVPMDHAVAVRVLDAVAHLAHHVHRTAHGETAAADMRLQAGAAQVLHGEVGLPLLFAQVVDDDDVAVRQLSRCARLTEEPLADLGVVADDCRDVLDGDRAAQQRVEGFVDNAHPAVADLFDDLVSPDRLDHDVEA